MKVYIPVDVAFAFDYLSILQLKFSKGAIPYEEVIDCLEELQKQVSVKVCSEIMDSREYVDLKYANELTFNAVDKAKKDEVPASYVDSCNYQRYLCKQALQKKFFPEIPLTETKINYGRPS